MSQPKAKRQPKRAGRLLLVALGIFSLVCGVWGGLIRVPILLPLPSSNANWITFHGPLMVCGFLGTVIALERAVGLQRLWTYSAPLLTGTGALAIAFGQLGKPPVMLIAAGSAIFVFVAAYVVRLQRAMFTVVMALAAVAWLFGNVLWLKGWPFSRVVPWWIAFLALTIAGERLDLSRFQKPSRWSKPLLLLALALFSAGVVSSTLWQIPGQRLFGAGLLALAAWLARFDIARRTIRQPGLPRFMAVCLLLGYVWLAFAGVLMMGFSPLESGLRYDAALHSFFVGFVFSMIFGHAPVIFPAVLIVQPVFGRRFYLHLVLLHATLLLRVTGDLATWPEARKWGAVGNAVAIGLFLLNTISGIILSRLSLKSSRRSKAAPQALTNR